jgi:hypothetical protein
VYPPVYGEPALEIGVASLPPRRLRFRRLAMGVSSAIAMIYTHVLNRGPSGVRSPADRMFLS